MVHCAVVRGHMPETFMARSTLTNYPKLFNIVWQPISINGYQDYTMQICALIGLSNKLLSNWINWITAGWPQHKMWEIWWIKWKVYYCRKNKYMKTFWCKISDRDHKNQMDCYPYWQRWMNGYACQPQTSSSQVSASKPILIFQFCGHWSSESLSYHLLWSLTVHVSSHEYWFSLSTSKPNHYSQGQINKSSSL